ncbi:MAG: ComEC/Rec2 family competence protein [Natronohydrobacter sp.]|nr:ComEC/Rec2 family competence protein [Natronohydrobacter sp.]
MDAIARQRGRLFLYVPVFLAIGIGSYFALPRDPTPPEWAALAALTLGLATLARWLSEDLAPLLIAAILTLCGVLLAGHRAHQVAAPVLSYRYYGAIEGRIVKIDRSSSDAMRLTLDQVVLERISPARTPRHVRISLHGQQGFMTPEPGLRIMTTGHLGPPPAPSEPGGFDFRRLAWFEGLGAVGYTRIPVLIAAPPDPTGQSLTRLRMRISAAVQDRIPGDRGGFAAAILTGDRSGIPQSRIEDLRRSNLAHLLAISGLHMGLLTGFVFGLLRLLMALVPPFALRAPTRKLAALGALGAGGFYLALSGGNVATERAYIMVAVMLVAVLLDRRAISLRSVAMAATLILILRPEALVQAGFQMSFAATIALVAVFRFLSDDRAWRDRLPRWALPVVSVILCSVVAGIATAPIAAASFNRIAEYGLIANLLTVPLMGLVIMPAAVLAALLAPFGLEGLGLALMSPAIGWILTVAEQVGALEGAVLPIIQPDPWVIPMLSLGALWLILWQGRARFAGLPVMALALLLWSQTTRPALLIAPEAELVGLMTPEGRALSRARAGSFTASSWLQADGDGADQAQAHARTGADPRAQITHLRGGGFDVLHLAGKRALADLDMLCIPGRIIVTTEVPEEKPRVCTLLTPADLRATGARAYDIRAGQIVMRSVTGASGARPWTGRTAP